jgi:fibronectin type 3 domain-containing protein
VLSRKDFLKLFAAGAVTVTVGSFINYNGLFNTYRLISSSKSPSILPSAMAQASGSWSVGQPTTVVAIHAALLPSGKVFYLAGSGYRRDVPNGPFEARILDPETGTEKSFNQPHDLFCIGITSLPNGNILLGGGTQMYDTNPENCIGEWRGLKVIYEVNWTSDTVEHVADMAHGRWYPTLLSLEDGKVMIVNGLDEYGAYNLLVEIYDPVTKTSTIKYDPNRSAQYKVGTNNLGTSTEMNMASCVPGANTPVYGGTGQGSVPNIGYYPKMNLLTNGNVLNCGGQDQLRIWNPATGVWSNLPKMSTARHYGCSFLLPLHNDANERGKVMVVGGSSTSSASATSTVQIIDFDAGTYTSPVLRLTSPLSFARKMQAPVILPDGKCAVFGGSSQLNTNPVHQPEMFDPVTETWQVLPTASIDRVYHQVSILLKDGRVWTAGSTVRSNVAELRTEVFSPPYLFQGPRPLITNTPTVGDYNNTITIPTNDPEGVQSVSLVRLMTTTHHYEANQRFVWLQILQRNTNNVVVKAPVNSRIAPPGYYMLHILNSSQVPSIAQIIKIPGTGAPPADTTPPSQVTGLAATTVNSSQIDLSWTANPVPDGVDHYNVYRGTTAGFPVTLGTTPTLATPTTNTYSNTGLTGSTTYYYKVAAVDAAGNIGTLSTESSATTSAAPDTTPPSQVTGLAATTVNSSQIDLSWTANPVPDGVDHYNVYRGTTAGFPVTLGTTPTLATPTTNTYSNTGLTGSTTYYYKVAAVDAAGNIGTLSTESSATTSAAPDTTIPNVAITSPTTGSTLPPGNITVTGTASDNTGGSGVRDVRVRVDSGAYVAATPAAPGDWSTWSRTVSITAEGAHTIAANVRDNAGNFRTIGINVTVSSAPPAPDTTIPNVAITSPTTGSTFPPGNITVTGTASDNTGGSGVRDVRVRVDSGAYVAATPVAPGDWSTWSRTVTINTTGSHVIAANVRDNAGNFRTIGVNITIT